MRRTPAYWRIYDDLATLIREGELEPSSQLLSESLLAQQYGVARMTVREAIGRLVEDNLVVRQQGVGTFVASDPLSQRSLNRLTSFTEDMGLSEKEIATEILAQEVIAPPANVALQLGLGKGARVVHIKRLRALAGVPISLHQSYLPNGEFPSLAREQLIDGSLYRTLEQVFKSRLRRADQRIKAVPAGGEVASLLAVAVGSPVMQTERTTMDARNKRIEFARSWTRPEIELTVHLER